MLFLVVPFLYLIVATRTLRNERLTLEARQMLFIYRFFGVLAGFVLFGAMLFQPGMQPALAALLPFLPIIIAESVVLVMKPKFEEKAD